MNLVIVEDEFMVAKRLNRLLSRILVNEVHTIQLFNTLDDAADYLSNHIIDILFLDLNLNGEDGFSLLKQQLSQSFHTIVVSANTDRALEAFELGVLDFVAKPFTQERLERAVSRVSDRNFRANCQYLSYRKAGGIQLLNVSDIQFIQAAGHYSEVVTLDGSIVLHDKHLDKLLSLLPTHYYRIHRSFIVNLHLVTRLHTHPGSKYSVILSTKQELPIGRTRVTELRAKLSSINPMD